MKSLDELVAAINNTKPGFASLLYRSKSDRSLSRYTIILGFKYGTLLIKSLAQLDELIPSLSGVDLDVANELHASVVSSIDSHKNGTQNNQYTKQGLYLPLANGLNVNTNDGSLQLFGLLQSKVVLEPGTPKKTNSSVRTIIKNGIRSRLSMTKFREFALDIGCIHQMKINGNTLVIE